VKNEASCAAWQRRQIHAADRRIKNLDETVAYVDRVLKHRRNGM